MLCQTIPDERIVLAARRSHSLVQPSPLIIGP